MPKQAFFACFELMAARFGIRKVPKCLENGRFWDTKWGTNGLEMWFSKMIPDH